MLTFIPLLIAASSGSGLHVTIDCAGDSIADICKQLSSTSKQKFEARDEIKDDHLVILVQNVPLQDFMSHLADVSYGSWHQENGVEVLRRDPAKLAALRQKREDELAVSLGKIQSDFKAIYANPFDAKLLASQIKTQVTALGSQGGSVQDQSQQGNQLANAVAKFQEMTPAAQGAKALFGAMPVSTLKQMEVFHRYVFSNHPTKLQMAFPDSCTPALNWVQAAGTAWFDESKGVSAVLRSLSNMAAGQSALIAAQPYTANDTYVLSIQRTVGNVFFSKLAVYEPSGNLIEAQTVLIGAPQNTRPPAVSANPADVVKVPDDIKAIAALMSGPSPITKDQAAELPKDISERLLHPTLDDPMSLVLYPLVKLAAEKSGQQVLLDGDYFANIAASAAKSGKFSLNQLNSSFLNMLTVTSQNGWTEGKVSSYDLFNDARLPRQALQDLLQADYDNKLDFWAYADFLSHLPLVSMLAPVMAQQHRAALDQLFAGKGSSFRLSGSDEYLAHLAGLLNSGERTKAMSPGGLLVSEMNDQAKKDVSALVYDLDPRFLSNASSNPEPGMPRATIMDEPTYAFGNGFPAAARLTIAGKAIGLEMEIPGSGPTEIIPITPAQLAFEIKEVQQGKRSVAALSNLYWNPGITYTVTLQVGEARLPMTSTYKPSSVPQKVNDWHDLPADVVRQIEEELKK